jgi:hypothetical protein
MIGECRIRAVNKECINISVFWAVAPCSLVDVYRRFSALMMEEASSSETSVNFYQTTWRYNPEDEQ